MAKKKTTKKRAASARVKRPHHPWDNHDLLMIVAGGFVVLVIVLFSSNYFHVQSMTQQTNDLSQDSMRMDNEKETAVTIQNFSFSPAEVHVKVGTTVTWTNKDETEHSATADDGSFDTGLLQQGDSGSVTFSKAGTVTYHCSNHPSMMGKIIVE